MGYTQRCMLGLNFSPQCNTTCGRGVKRRTVLCVGITGGKFQIHEDEECDASKQPGEEDTCFERPCFKWYTTPWSEVAAAFKLGIWMCTYIKYLYIKNFDCCLIYSAPKRVV